MAVVSLVTLSLLDRVQMLNQQQSKSRKHVNM